MQFALYEPCSKDDDTDDEATDNIDTRMIRIFVYKGGCCGKEDGVRCQLTYIFGSVILKYLVALLVVLTPT